jgi:hypothetical protein
MDANSMYTMNAMQYQQKVGDYQQGMTITQQTSAEVKKNVMERWKIQQDAQTKTNEIIQDANVYKAKTNDNMFKKWDEFMRQ